jgi:MFS family permease
MAGSVAARPAGGAGGRFAAFGVLRERDFRLLFAGMAVSSFAMPMQWVTQMWLVLELTGGTHAALWLGVTGFVRGLPILLLSLYGGALADRMDRRHLLIGTQLASIAAAALIAALIAAGAMTIWLLLPLIFLSSAALSFDQPTRQALVPDLVPRERVADAVALNSMAMFAAMAGGPALAGFLIGSAGVAVTYAVVAVTYVGVLVAVLLLRFRPHPLPAAGPRASTLSQIGEGIAYVRREPAVLWLISVTFAVTVLGMSFTNLAPLVVTQTIGAGASALGWVLTAWGVGAVIASFVLAGWLRALPAKGLLVLVMIAVFVAGLIGFAYSTSVPAAAFFQFVPGLSNTALMVISNAVILAVAPAAMRGRVMGIYYMNRGLMPFGALLAAVLGEWAGVQHGIAALALLCGLAVALITLRQKGAWRRVQTALA